MRICQLIAPGPMAGAEKVVLAGSRALVEHGHELALLVLDESRRPECAHTFIAEARARALNVHRITVRGRMDLFAVRQLSRALDDLAPEVVHAHGYKALAYGVAASRVQTPLFATHHGDTSHTSQVHLYEQLARSLYAAVKGVFAVSDETASALAAQGVSAESIRVVENPICLKAPGIFRHRRRGDARTRLLFLGRLSVEKGLETLLTALASVCDQGAWHLQIAGEGPDRMRLEALTAQLGLASSVDFLGHRIDIPELLEGADMLVLPSLREGLPLAVLEAAAFGLPIVASRVGGIPGVVEHGVNGQLVEAARSDTLANALEHVRANLDDYTWASRTRAPAVRARFSPERWVSGTLAGYQSKVA